MQRFKVCLERYVNECATVEVEAATAKEARIGTRSGSSSPGTKAPASYQKIDKVELTL